MREIGGYFNLELDYKNDILHADGVLLNTGRNSLEYVLRSLDKVQKVYLPYFTCEVILEPLSKLQIKYDFYSINERFELTEDLILAQDEYLIYTNYFGIKDKYVYQLASIYNKQLIVDNAQAFYAEHIPDINTIYSPRKFMGLPDGGIAYANGHYNVKERDVSYERCSHLLKRYDIGPAGGYNDFRTNSEKLKGLPICRMSHLTEALMHSINYECIKNKRRENFNFLHRALKDNNKLSILFEDEFACPMVYPYFSENPLLKSLLIKEKIFVATYWPNVLNWCKPTDIEYQLADRIIAIPIDQRYGEDEMKLISEKILG